MPKKEPSVLDYFKSRVKFWEPSEQGILPPEPKQPKKGTAPSKGKPAAASKTAAKPAMRQGKPAAAAKKLSGPVAPPRPLPWRSLLALAFALVGQSFFEPLKPAAPTGLYFYALSASFLLWAALRKEWTLAALPEAGEGDETFKVRRLPLILAIILALVAFISLGGNLFTPFNVTVWVLAILCIVWAFWRPSPGGTPLWKRLGAFFSRASWPLAVTRWTLLVLLVIGLVVFFRVYRLASVPSDPFSDHAEKILDVYDVTQGQTHIFFPRNTGREGFQMYLTVVVAWLFGTGLSFLSLKIDSLIAGLVTLPYLYLLGKELGGKRIGLLAVLFAGIGYWPNVISRVGLRFALYPLFFAPMLYYLLRGLRRRARNDFICSGIFLGLGLHGYSSYRIVPFVVVIAIGLFLLHAQAKDRRRSAVFWLVVVTAVSFFVFLPLARYWSQNPDLYAMRAFSRLGTTERPLPGPWWQILVSNVWNGLRMFNWDNGEIWVHSIPHRPALDIVSAALFLIGVVLIIVRYVRQRHWLDIFLLLSIPLLQLPSTLSLAFPAENPSLNRPAGAIVPVFLIVAAALDGLLTSLASRLRPRWGAALMWIVALALVAWSAGLNFKLVLDDYSTQFSRGAWNTSEMGTVIKQFAQVYGTTDSAWIVPYPYWADTRLPAIYIGIPTRDFALWPKDFASTLEIKGAKLMILKPDDTQDLAALQQIYPRGVVSTFHSAVVDAGKDFLIFFVPPVE
jgi:hypothetical protein